jgi:hypothetical protein
MAQPTGRDLHVDQLLTNVSIGYSNPEYIADKIFPIVPVNKQSNIVPKYDQSHWFRDAAALRASGTKSSGGGWTVDNTDTYYCHRYSFRDEISDEDRDNTDQPYNLDRDAAEFVTDKTAMKREVKFATDFFTTSVWGADKVGGTDFTKFSDYGASEPLVVFEDHKEVVDAKIGRDPNTLVLGKQVWRKLKWHPDLVDTIKYTQKGQVSLDLFTSLVEFERVLIGGAIYTTTAEGTAEGSVSYSRIWGKNGLMLYVPKSASLKQPAAGYTFVWERVTSAINYIKRMRDEEREVDIIESNSYFDQKATATRAGLFQSNLIA